ncbi:MAG: hypothetical protein M1401_02660 [Chloroflexi bacterium]|nr:hypothetical protein [Chloroflexota bacterium]MCL5107775.1 hypothetical protein [Chloroflexota bacterium]
MGDGNLTMREMGRRGGNKTAERHGHEFYCANGKKGADVLTAKYGHEHFVAIGRKGGQRRSELLAKGKAAEAAETRLSESY